MTDTQENILGSDLLNYCKASSASAFGDGNPCTSWVDEVNSIDWAEATNAPNYVANQRAGHPAIKFDGTNDFLTANSSTLDLAGGFVAIFCLAARDTATGIATLASCYSSSSDYARMREQNNAFLIQDAGGMATIPSLSNSIDPCVVAYRYESGRTSIICEFDSGASHLDETKDTATGTPVKNPDWYLGKRGDNVQYWDGAIHEFCICNVAVARYNVLKAMTQMRYDYDISDADPEPPTPSGGTSRSIVIGS